MTDQEKALEVVKLLHDNLMQSFKDSKVIFGHFGNAKVETKYGKMSVAQVIDFDKVRTIEAYLTVLFIAGLAQDYFGNADYDTLIKVFTEVYDRTEIQTLMSIHLK